ncbi:MAG: peptidyl-alpha-hydroxyglycine alpha-amidating lyase family protein [Thaumarchaeota archaeon]|nr:peptidyl-alpha-hydroxyglycine alpha-amidating lyase family protein [Nitrososphaerota archaeon]
MAADAQSRVYVFSRSEHPMMVFAPDGEFVTSWGEGLFAKPHNVRVSPDGFVHCSDIADHTVKKFTRDGKLVQTLGTKDVPSDTGSSNFKTIKRAAGPFNGPTDIAFDGVGDLYISDGYANSRVHRFSRDGELLSSWGSPGALPGQFNLPHGALIGKGKVIYVLDRENNRVQLFTLGGEFVSQWTDFAGPTGISPARDGSLFICEFGYDPAVPVRYSVPSHGQRILPRITVRSPEGELLAKIEGEDKCTPGCFFAPHSLCVDPHGDIYVAEVPITRRAPQGCHTLQKLVRQ